MLSNRVNNDIKASSLNLAFVLLSFEGPDRYSQAGGLGVRVTNLANALAGQGFETNLLFVGDPELPSVEVKEGGMLTLHRWGQWISRHHPTGVYDSEESKLQDFNESVPPFLAGFIRSRAEEGKTTVVLAEEWHTAEAVIRLRHRLGPPDADTRYLAFWNANNTMSFHRLNWPALAESAQLTTVSHYMKHLMWRLGVNPLVIPNGIPRSLLDPLNHIHIRRLRQTLDPTGEAVVLFKTGRFDPAKRWMMAIEAAALLKREGYAIAFPISGGIEPHGSHVVTHARHLGLSVVDVNGSPSSVEDFVNLLRSAPRADVFNLRFHLSPDILQTVYAAADAVLANSGHEPFGLVGLEAMASGGVVFTGATGEEYAFSSDAAFTVESDDPAEIVASLTELRREPEKAEQMRANARRQAARFTWERVLDSLLYRIRLGMRLRGLIGPAAARRPLNRVENVVVYTVVHQPRRLRLPAVHIPPGAGIEEMRKALFDDPMNERYFRKVAAKSYYPGVRLFRDLVDRGLKLGIGFSLSFIQQARQWDSELLAEFQELVQHENVELICVEPTHSFALLWDVPLFVKRMELAAERLEEVFGSRPVVTDTTELMMSDTIYHGLQQAGFRAAFMDGRPWVLEWRSPAYLYRHGQGTMKLLARHYPLSDDVGYRFSNRSWSEWPLMADRYADWLAGNHGNAVVVGWDFETFGEHHPKESGIFDFMRALPAEVNRAGLSFATPSEVVDRFENESYELTLPQFASTWAGSGGLEFFLGNDAQRAVFQLMIQAHQKARLTGDPDLIELALWLAQSDNLHLIQWFGRAGSEAEVSAYFTPNEWWSLTPEGIVWEIQEVYKNFMRTLDDRIASRQSNPAR